MVPASPILFCSHVVELGGAELVLLDLLTALDRERFAPHLAVPGPGPLSQRAAALQVPVHEIPIAGRTPVQKALAALRAGPVLRGLAAELGCRVLVANSMIAGYAGVRAQHAGLACVWHLHIVTGSRLARLAVRRAAAVITPSHAALAAVGAPARGTVVPNGVPERFFGARGDGLRARLRIGPGVPLFGIFGRLDPDKGHERLLQTMRELRGTEPVHLVVAGAELFADVQPRLLGFAARLRALAATPELAGRVHWLGQVDDTAPLLAQIDALVVPSIAPESAPRTIAEAQAAGCPVVASAIGGIGEMIADGESGLLVSPTEPAALAAALERLASNPNERARLAQGGRRHADANYRLATFARRCEQVFRASSGIGIGRGDVARG